MRGELARSIIVVRGFYTDERVVANIASLAEDVAGRCDVVFLYDAKPAKVDTRQLPANVPSVSFHQDNWVKYKQPDPYNKTFIPGNEETMFLMFQEQCPDYDFYWFIEYDVEYTGNWWQLFDAFASSQADLLATSMVGYEDYPSWGLWKSLTPPAGATLEDADKIRSFLPVCRFSARALEELRARLAEGWSGHPEALVATLLKRAGHQIEDIGGDGDFVTPANRNRFYSNNRFDPDLVPGTFVFRPKMREPGSIPDMLWHPVKPDDVVVWDTRLGFWQRLVERCRGWVHRLIGVGKRG